jgi:hypothetical protein
MAITRYRLLSNVHLTSDGFTHATHIMEQNFTFCGIASTHDEEESTETINKVDCPRCIQFIDYCKSFKEANFNRKNMQ